MKLNFSVNKFIVLTNLQTKKPYISWTRLLEFLFKLFPEAFCNKKNLEITFAALYLYLCEHKKRVSDFENLILN